MSTLAAVVASMNPVKIRATKNAFEKVFAGTAVSVKGASVPSGVADQPSTDSETLLGAENRAGRLAAMCADGAFCVGIEGGIDRSERGVEAFAWVVIQRGDVIGRSRSSSFELPPEVVELLDAGLELGDANDRVFGTENSKHEAGAVGLLTAGVVDRTALYEQAVVLALIPFANR